MSHGTVEASTHWGLDASLLENPMDGQLALMQYLQTNTRVCLEAILSADEALRNLGTFDFVNSYLFSVDGRHLSAVAELRRLIERLEEILTNVQGMTTSPNLAAELLYDVLRRWILYHKTGVDESTSEALEAPVATVLFKLYPILLKIEGGSYVEPILPGALMDLLADKRPFGTKFRGGKGGGAEKSAKKDGASRGSVRVRVRYRPHLPTLSLWGRENLRTLVAETVLPTMHFHVLCNI